MTQTEKAQQLQQLHSSGKLLLLPNIWDVLGAKLLESMNYPAIATASASIALSNGYPDGELIPFNIVVENLKRISASVNLPVTADIESAYANENKLLEQNIRLLIETGIAGINFEDTNHSTKTMNELSVQSNKIKLIRKVADEMGVQLFINARTDVLIHPEQFATAEAKQAELIKRGLAYKDAGADCFFPIAIKSESAIAELISTLQMPINILAILGIPEFKQLEQMGVARVSLGPSFLKIAIQAMQKLAADLKQQKGLTAITENNVTTDYLKSLIKK
ncbi:MAG: isocitrate lyase/phosphoenolpyruvate mutase family protein [Bacteroidia bacterium]|nr:isocitrate lyase/phosphoenolpyruvate mutase family protein [Bacteroidia bacterium]